jgi:hypothetical protein
MMSVPTRRSSLYVERLESRCLLAGNVVARVIDGRLAITGDDAANRISIESAGEGRIQVRGFNDAAGLPTKVNGTNNALRVFNNVTGDIVVDLRGGNDLVRVTNLVTPRNLRVTLGDGHDEAVTGRDRLGGERRFANTPSGPLIVNGTLMVQGGAGNDHVFQSNLLVKSWAQIQLGAGNDVVQTQRPQGGMENVHIEGGFAIQAGTGRNVIDLYGVVVEKNFTIDGASGELYLSARSMDVLNNFYITTGIANDSIDISSTNTRRLFQLRTGAGDDTVRLGVIAKTMDVHLGAGNDSIELNGSHLDSLLVDGAAGNDVMFVRNTRAIDAVFNGGEGFDRLHTSSSLPNRITRSRSESIESTRTLI